LGMTITEKILALHSGVDRVSPGQIVEARIDIVYGHEVTTPPAIRILEENGLDEVFDPERIVLTPDHFVPNKDISSAELAKKLRDWARKHGIRHYFEVGEHGICHAIVPEKGFVWPGAVIVAGDSHTCTLGAFGAFATGIGSTDLAAAIHSGRLWFVVPPTLKFVLEGRLGKGVFSKDVILHIISKIGVDGASYKAMEFSGPIISSLSMDARMTICNMAIEAGAKNGIMEPDDETFLYIERHGGEGMVRRAKDMAVWSDPDAGYEAVYRWDLSDLEPLVAFPHIPSNVRTASEAESLRIRIDQAYLGSCTNGRLEDLEIAAEIMKGRRVAKGVRMIVVPATTEVWREAERRGLLEVFVDSGAAVSTPTCGACLGGHMGVLADGEVCISTTNRNFKGRMGHPGSQVFLASPATVAASAIAGYIVDPRGFMG